MSEIKNRLDIKTVAEYETIDSSKSYPERNWDMIRSMGELGNHDMIYIFRAQPKLVTEIVSKMNRGLVMISCTNKHNIGFLIQKLLRVPDEYYATKTELEEQIRNLGLDIVESGYFDSPFWPDHSRNILAPSQLFDIDDSLIKQLLFFERFNNNKYMAHHAYVIGRVDR